jgi:hypothetical protein
MPSVLVLEDGVSLRLQHRQESWKLMVLLICCCIKGWKVISLSSPFQVPRRLGPTAIDADPRLLQLNGSKESAKVRQQFRCAFGKRST